MSSFGTGPLNRRGQIMETFEERAAGRRKAIENMLDHIEAGRDLSAYADGTRHGEDDPQRINDAILILRMTVSLEVQERCALISDILTMTSGEGVTAKELGSEISAAIRYHLSPSSPARIQ